MSIIQKISNFEIKNMIPPDRNNSLQIIKNSTSELLPDSRIILFGSQARQDNSENSDYDFMIITKNSFDIQQKRFYQSLLRKKLASYKIPADIFIQSEEEVKIKKNITGHIVREILKEGIAI